MFNAGAFFKRYSTFFVLGAIIVLVVAVYFPSLQNDFVNWDDEGHIVKNTSIQILDFDHIKDMFNLRVNLTYIPLTTLSFAIEHHFFGYDPFIFHLNNLILHILVIILIYYFTRSIGLSALGAGVAVLIFSIHPTRVESVAWVTERKDVLYSFFYLLGLLTYLKYLKPFEGNKLGNARKPYGLLALTGVFGVLSILAKPMALSFPLILLLLDWFKGRDIDDKTVIEKLPIFAIIGAIGWITYYANARVPGQNAIEGLLIWSWTFAFYLRQFLFPFISVPIFNLPDPVAFSNAEYVLSLLVAVLVVVSLIRFYKSRWFMFAFGFYFLSIFFLLRFDDLKDITIVADRFMYLPSVGFCVLLGAGFERLWHRPQKPLLKTVRALAVVLLIAVTIAFSCKTHKQSLVWKNGITLWKHELSVYPEEPIALNNLATMLRTEPEYVRSEEEYRKIVALRREYQDIPYTQEMLHHIGKVDYIMGLYDKAIDVDREYTKAHYNLANLYFDLGMLEQAEEYYNNVLKIEPDYLDAHFRLGEIYAEKGKPGDAVPVYRKILEIRPDNEKVYVSIIVASHTSLEEFPENAEIRQIRDEAVAKYEQMVLNKEPDAKSFFTLGWIFSQMKDYGRAISAYEMALEVNSNHADTLFNLGNIYKDGGRLKEAISLYERTLKVDPRKISAYLNLGNIYGRWGDYDKAIGFYKKATVMDPDNAKAYFSLGYASSFAGNIKEAMASYQKSLELDPNNAEAYFHLGTIYTTLENNRKAIDLYKNAVSVNPGYMEAYVNLSLLSYKEGAYADAVRYLDQAVLLGYLAPVDYLQVMEPHRALSQ